MYLKNSTTGFYLTIIFFWLFTGIFAQVGINTSGNTPDNSAGLDIDFNNKGILIPHIALNSTTTASPVSSPATSLLVYNTATAGDVTPGYYYWDGSQWVRLLNTGNSSGKEWLLEGNAGTTPGTDFLGTTDAQDLVFKTNNTEKFRILTNGDIGIGTATPDELLELSGGGIQINGEYGIGFAGAKPYATNNTSDQAKIYYLNDGTQIGAPNTYNDYLIIEKTDGNGTPPDGGIAFVNRGDNGIMDLAMVIKGNGKIGINTANPDELLELSGGGIQINGEYGIGFAGAKPYATNNTSDQAKIYYLNDGTQIGAPNTYNDYLIIEKTDGNNTSPDGGIAFVNRGDNGIMDLAMVINGNGNVGIGTTSPIGKLDVAGSFHTGTGLIAIRNQNSTNEGGEIYLDGPGNYNGWHLDNYQGRFRWHYGGDEYATIKANGDFGIGTAAPTAKLSVNGSANKPGGGLWAAFSDRRSKNNIKDYNKGLKELLQLHPVSYQYKKEFGWGDKTYVGLIAQEVEKVVPTMVSEIEVKGIKDFKEVDASELTYILVNAIKEQQKEIEELKTLVKKILK